MTGKLFDASTFAKGNSREAVEAAIERAKSGPNATWDIPQKRPSVPHWDGERPAGEQDANTERRNSK
jgi:hypothetical protein